jgi:hypothetical protein
LTTVPAFSTVVTSVPLTTFTMMPEPNGFCRVQGWFGCKEWVTWTDYRESSYTTMVPSSVTESYSSVSSAPVPTLVVVPLPPLPIVRVIAWVGVVVFLLFGASFLCLRSRFRAHDPASAPLLG